MGNKISDEERKVKRDKDMDALNDYTDVVISASKEFLTKEDIPLSGLSSVFINAFQTVFFEQIEEIVNKGGPEVARTYIGVSMKSIQIICESADETLKQIDEFEKGRS